MKVVKLEDCINEIKSLDNNGFVNRSVNHICEDMRKEVTEFDAIPLDEVEQAKEEIQELLYQEVITDNTTGEPTELTETGEGLNMALDVIYKLIAESEG